MTDDKLRAALMEIRRQVDSLRAAGTIGPNVHGAIIGSVHDAEAALAASATDEPCGWDTRRGDGPIGGPCVLPANHDGPHAASATDEGPRYEGHRTTEPHDCFTMRCHDLADDLEREARAHAITRDHLEECRKQRNALAASATDEGPQGFSEQLATLGGPIDPEVERRIIENARPAVPAALDVEDIAQKAAQIGFTYGALGRDFAFAFKNVNDMLEQERAKL